MAKNKGQTDIIIYPAWCKGCAICVTFCPAKALALNESGKAGVVAGEECINCGFCESHCPDFAIMVRPRQTYGRRHTDKIDKVEETAAETSPVDVKTE